MAQPSLDGFVIWFTGLPASGKTTLAHLVKEQLAERRIHAIVLDSDDLRAVLTPEPAYTEQERDWFYNVIAYLAAFLSANGVNVLVAATAHRRRYRDRAREQIGRFAEVFVRCSLETCKERDPKGIYTLAEAGQAESVPGVGADYESPIRPAAVIDTTNTNPLEAARSVLAQLRDRGIIVSTKGDVRD